MKTIRIAPKPFLSVDYTGDGPLVLFMHGVGGNRSNWSDQLVVFAAHFKAAAWDARGYGDSDDLPDIFSFGDFADDVPRALDHFAVPRAHLVGLSMGGHIALDAAIRHGSRVASLTLCDTNIGFANLSSQQKKEFVELRTKRLREGGSPEEIAEPIAKVLSGRASTPKTLQRLIKSMGALRKHNYVRIVESMVDLDFADKLNALDLPTQIIVGEDDRLTPPSAAMELQRFIAGSELTIIPSAGHLSNIECPDQFNHAALSFLLNMH